jgi:hypothetical protein
MDTLDNGVHWATRSSIVLDAPSTITALGTAIAVVSLVVTLGKGLIGAVRVGKALGAEIGFFKKSG